MADQAVQDAVDPDNPCFGCGPDNEQGLQIKSYPRDDDGLVATFQPKPHHAGSAGVLGGGIQATLIDCHGIWTAVDWHGREDDGETVPHYVTAEMQIRYKRPVPLEDEVELVSEVVDVDGRRVRVRVELRTEAGDVGSVGEVVCHRLDEDWGPSPTR